MKRSFCLLLVLLICLVLPVSVFAETFTLSDTDMSIDFDTSSWYVFTRDNLENNPELEELELTYDEMHSLLYDNSAYLNAALALSADDYIELFIRKNAQTTGVANLTNYSKKEVQEFATALAEQQNTQVYSVYQNQYNFAKLEYKDANVGVFVYEFYTIVNKQNYTFTFQSETEFTEEKRQIAEQIVDSVKFNVDTSLKEPDNGGSNIIAKTIGGAIVGGLAGGAVALFNKKKAKKATTPQGPELD